MERWAKPRFANIVTEKIRLLLDGSLLTSLHHPLKHIYFGALNIYTALGYVMLLASAVVE